MWPYEWGFNQSNSKTIQILYDRNTRQIILLHRPRAAGKFEYRCMYQPFFAVDGVHNYNTVYAKGVASPDGHGSFACEMQYLKLDLYDKTIYKYTKDKNLVWNLVWNQCKVTSKLYLIRLASVILDVDMEHCSYK